MHNFAVCFLRRDIVCRVNDTALQQAHEKSASYCQIVTVFSISIDLHRLNNAEMLTVIISAHDAPGLKYRKVFRVGCDIHLKAAALVVFNIPQERRKTIAHCFKCDRQIAFICFHVIHFNLHITPPNKRSCER
ncbi:MAG: hypothetical protein BWZ04_02580 [Firmicutes bacterium ADurb.BinA205]|nr:MAG: hypothetical protein BWZ04_02580 [Firmicutes bacterium ADurb.BinA205]